MSLSNPLKRDKTINIIGCGDVVLNRLLPALLDGDLNVSQTDIKVFSIDERDHAKLKKHKKFSGIDFICPQGSHSEKQEAIVNMCISQNAPVVISTPSDSHYYYLTRLVAADIQIICEKPLIRFKNEIHDIQKNAELYQGKVFALSYYSLEKALPLTYFLQLNAAHLPLLDFEGLNLDDTPNNNRVLKDLLDDLGQILDDLGQIKEIDFYLHEGVERSPNNQTRRWIENPNEHAYETLLHLLILANKTLQSFSFELSDLNLDCIRGSCVEAFTPKATTYLRLTNWKAQQVEGAVTIPYVSLAAGKYMPNHLKRRGGILTFENGIVDVDFDDMSICIQLHGHSNVTIRNKLRKKYETLSTLINRFLNTGFNGVRFDEFDEQIQVLSWMSSFEFEPEDCFKYSMKFEGCLKTFETVI